MVTLEIIEVGATVHYNNGNKRPIFLEKCIKNCQRSSRWHTDAAVFVKSRRLTTIIALNAL